MVDLVQIYQQVLRGSRPWRGRIGTLRGDRDCRVFVPRGMLGQSSSPGHGFQSLRGQWHQQCSNVGLMAIDKLCSMEEAGTTAATDSIFACFSSSSARNFALLAAWTFFETADLTCFLVLLFVAVPR